MLLFWSVESALEERAFGDALSEVFELMDPIEDINFSFVRNLRRFKRHGRYAR